MVMVTELVLPDPAMFVLAGAAGSGKSYWAAERFRRSEIVSSDSLRAAVGSGPADLDASLEAFSLLDTIVAARLRRSLTTVIDTLGLDQLRRTGYLVLARSSGLPAVLVIMNAAERLCRERNRLRDRPVPAPVLTDQLRKIRSLVETAADEGWDHVLVVDSFEPRPDATDDLSAVDLDQQRQGRPRVILQISRFPWASAPAAWLGDIALAAESIGFNGIALMDHLIQIPQVDRAWEPIPEPWVTLGLLAGLDTKLRLGTLVSPVTFRAPGIIAKPAQRLDQLQRCIETLRAIWAPGTKAYAGRYLNLPETTCYPRPAGQIPIIVGGSGEHRTLKIVAEQADGCNLPSDEPVLSSKMDILRR